MAVRFIKGLAAAVLIGVLALAATSIARGGSDDDLARVVDRQVRSELEDAGVAVAVRANGQTSLFDYGMADAERRVTSDTLFNLGSVGKVFDTTLLALADLQGELSLNDPVAKYVTELQQGHDIREITLRQLATYTSGLVLPQDHPPWPTESFTLPEFLSTLNAWTADEDHLPGRQMIYSHAGYVLLHLALERRFGIPFDALMRERLLKPLGLDSTILPVASQDPEHYPRGEIPANVVDRAVQGYSPDGEAIGAPGDLQGYYHWLGTGQMYSSARDMSVFLAANLDEELDHGPLAEAMQRAHQGEFRLRRHMQQALAWEVHQGRNTIVDKYGGMDNASAYIGLMPARKLGVVVLGNRGGMAVAEVGRYILRALARQ
jgi:beta-lactamase class C